MQFKIKYGYVLKNESEIEVSLSKTVEGSDYKRNFNLDNIISWHYAKQTTHLPLNRWWTFLIVILTLSIPMVVYTFLKNNSSLESYEVLWSVLAVSLQIITILGFALFVVWLLFDLLMGWKIIEALLIRILKRKETMLCLRFKTDKELDILLKNKKEGVRLVLFLNIPANNN